MTKTQPIDVFISRKSEDAKYAKAIYDYLTNEGLSIFESDHSLRELGNADYISAIDDALENTKHLMVVASSKANITSSWVEAEWKFFLNRKRSGKASGNLFTVICSNMQLEQVPASLQNYEVIPFNKKNFPTIYNYSKQKKQPAKPQPKEPLPFNDGNWFKKATLVLFTLLLLAVVIATYFVTRPFDATVFLKVKPKLNLSNSYPPFEKGALSLFINGKEEPKEVLSNGEVNFRQLDYADKNEWVKAHYKGKYWKLERDSIMLGTENNINVIPDGSLATVFGHTLDANGKPLKDVKVLIDTDTFIYSDANGVFRIELPVNMQKRKYQLSAHKEGFEITKENYYPISSGIDLTLKTE